MNESAFLETCRYLLIYVIMAALFAPFCIWGF